MASRIKEIVEGLPAQVRQQVEIYRDAYTRTADNYDDMRLHEETRIRMGGYALGFMHAGLLTEFERRAVFCYMTVKVRDEERLDNEDLI